MLHMMITWEPIGLGKTNMWLEEHGIWKMETTTKKQQQNMTVTVVEKLSTDDEMSVLLQCNTVYVKFHIFIMSFLGADHVWITVFFSEKFYPHWLILSFFRSVFFVILSVCLTICMSTQFGHGCDFWFTQGSLFIYGVHTPWFTRCKIMSTLDTLWPWPCVCGCVRLRHSVSGTHLQLICVINVVGLII